MTRTWVSFPGHTCRAALSAVLASILARLAQADDGAASTRVSSSTHATRSRPLHRSLSAGWISRSSASNKRCARSSRAMGRWASSISLKSFSAVRFKGS